MPVKAHVAKQEEFIESNIELIADTLTYEPILLWILITKNGLKLDKKGG